MNTENDYITIGTKMAQALQDIIDETCAAENCQPTTERCKIHATDLTELVDEWETIYSNANIGWQKQIINTKADDDKFIDTLGLTHLTPQAG
jgi:hypothetical protein